MECREDMAVQHVRSSGGSLTPLLKGEKEVIFSEKFNSMSKLKMGPQASNTSAPCAVSQWEIFGLVCRGEVPGVS